VSETRKIAAILVADVVGYSRLAGADEERTLARLRALRGDLIEPAIAVHHGRIVKGTGDGFIAEFRSVVDAARCAIEVQTGMIERNAGVASDRRIEFRIGAHLSDVVEEADGDLMGDGVNIAARLEGICAAGAICLSQDAYRQVKDRLDLAATGLAKIFTGRAKEAEAHIGEALRLSPRDTTAYALLTEAGIAKNHLGDCEHAVLWCRRAIEANRNYPEAHFHLAAALARLGRLDEANSAVKAGLALNPSFTVSRALVDWAAMSDDPTHPQQLAPIFEGLRRAGLPEQ
jgi:class 3 adenylate cyclase